MVDTSLLFEVVEIYGTMLLVIALFVIISKLSGWSYGVERSIKHTEQNIKQLEENIQNLTNDLSRLETRVTVLSDQMNTRLATLSKTIDDIHGLRRMSTSFPGGDYDPWNSASQVGQTANPDNPNK